MIDHVSIGVADITRAKSFYDAALQPLGYACLSASDACLGYGRGAAAFWLNRTTRPVQPDPGSGLHFCFAAPTRASVDAFHRAALTSGGRDNGDPGARAEYGDNYYAAFVIDPDGYRVEACCTQPARHATF
jgi:catechol 2,3-dioxygenase-like lactoylglutathione lyase family enzyme